MKRISALFGACLVALALFSSCTKSDYNSGSGKTGYNPFYSGPVETNGTFSAVINGSAFNPPVVNAVTTSLKPGISISGFVTTDPAAEGIVIGLPDPYEPGTYYLGSGTSVMYKPAGGTPIWATTAEVIIESKTKEKIKGTFYFNAPDIEVKEGKFDLKIKNVEL